MQKLLALSFSILFSMGLFAQQSVFSGSDAKLKYEVKVEKITDEVNDNFYEYYNLEIKNTSSKSVSFTPVFNFTNENGEKRSTSNDGDTEQITLAPGASIKGHVKNQAHLTLFKQYLVGNSGKKASNNSYKLNSVSINY